MKKIKSRPIILACFALTVVLVAIISIKLIEANSTYEGMKYNVGVSLPEYSQVISYVLPKAGSQVTYEDFGVVCYKQVLKLGHTVSLSDYKLKGVHEFNNYKTQFATDLANNLTLQITLPKGSNDWYVHRIKTSSKYIQTTRGLRIGNSEDTVKQLYGDVVKTGDVYSITCDNRCMDITVSYGVVTGLDIYYS